LGGLKKGSISVPVHINQIPSAIPQQRRLLRPLASTLLGGVLPFIIISSELYFITRSTWSHRIYSMFGFLFLCVGLAILSATSVTIIMVYFMLCSQNHRWVWQSYFVTGSCAFFVFGYGIIKPLGSLLKSSFVSVCLYMGYLLLVSFLMFMLLGSVGFVATSTVQSRSISRITRH
jgi:transmembrane 9 superfamily protein 2/4